MEASALDALLVRWHRWSADPSTSPDTSMIGLDAMIQTLEPCFIAALIVEARNLNCGFTVWRTPRAGGKNRHYQARGKLLRKLADARWLANSIVIHYNERGNRVGESNPGATVPDRIVDLCVQMRAQTNPDTGRPVYSLGQLAMRFKVAKSTVQAWCDGNRRGQAASKIVRAEQ